ncbi:MAG: hypothetical protein HUJ74_01050 [Lachnospiraceae bacterium]|nr:hypothetical protein [Lachnospiraceae bacterium]
MGELRFLENNANYAWILHILTLSFDVAGFLIVNGVFCVTRNNISDLARAYQER